MQLRDVYLKAKAVVESCTTSDHCIVAFQYLEVAQKYANNHARRTKATTDHGWACDIECLDYLLIDKRSSLRD